MTKTNPADILAALGPETRATIERETEHLAVPAGRTLFHMGEAGDSLYLVLAGSLGVFTPTPDDELQLAAVIQAGETVGEMGVISGQPRLATVKAIRDCELLRLTKARFDVLQKTEPQLMAGLSRLLAHRLRLASRGLGTHVEPKTIAFLPIDETIDTARIAEPLAMQLHAEGYTVKLLGHGETHRTSRWFTELERSHDHIFLCGALGDEEWFRLCARQADRILLIARANGPATPALPKGLLQQRAEHQLLDLLLLHEGDGKMATPARSCSTVPFNRLFHLRLGVPRDWQRIARVIVGRGLGLVLSGGGARAFAQIGVMKALKELGMTVDFVGGSSMGAILAAGLAMDWSVEELTERVYVSFVKSNPLDDYTLPIVGLVRGRKVERRLHANFGKIDIADLWLPFFCVSSNLTLGKLHVHRAGDLADALRASISLPGILPPFVCGDSLLVDGAVMNNLPVDVMRSTHRGPVVAVDVTQDRSVTPDILKTPTGLAWFKRFLNPPLITILMRAGTVSSFAQHAELAKNADLLLAPPLGDIDIRDWQAFYQAIAIGYAHAMQVLPEAQAKLARPRVAAAA